MGPECEWRHGSFSSLSPVSQPQRLFMLFGPNAHVKAGYGAGGLLSWSVNLKAFCPQKMSSNRSKMFKNANCSWFPAVCNQRCGCSGHDLNKHQNKIPGSSRMFKHFTTQCLSDTPFLLILQWSAELETQMWSSAWSLQLSEKLQEAKCKLLTWFSSVWDLWKSAYVQPLHAAEENKELDGTGLV